jgi:hypothetical protein
MLKKLMLAGVAVGMMALNAPIAHAAVVRSGCGFDSVSQVTVTGETTFTGGAYGYAVFDDSNTHTLRCYITVDGSEVSGGSTPTDTGATFLHVQGEVSYSAAEGASVEECTEIDGSTVSCSTADETQVPPQEVLDAIDTVFAVLLTVAETVDGVLAPVYAALDSAEINYLDPIICQVLRAAAPGIPGVIDITPEGDTTIAVLGPFWDCPPYGNLFPPA